MKNGKVFLVYPCKSQFDYIKVGCKGAYNTMRLPVPGHFYSCVVSKYLLRENEISFLLL